MAEILRQDQIDDPGGQHTEQESTEPQGMRARWIPLGAFTRGLEIDLFSAVGVGLQPAQMISRHGVRHGNLPFVGESQPNGITAGDRRSAITDRGNPDRTG